MTLQAALYLRVSLDRTGERLAVDRQREDGEQLIQLRGWQLQETFTDNDISAAGTKRRPGFEALLEAVRANRIEVVVAWSLDRLTRNRRDQLRLIETCHKAGVNLALVRGSDMDLTSAVGRAVVDILSTTARLENEQKAERQIRANQQAARQGRMNGGRRAFGYTADGLHLDVDEAPILATMYRLFNTGSSLGSIARWLNDTGLSTTQGNRWQVESVRVVLSNPRNAGLRASRTADPRSGVRRFFHDEPVARAVWPAAVEESTWRLAVAQLKDPARRRSSSTKPKYLLSGIAECGRCGQPMSTSWSQGVRVLRCRTRKHLSRRADQIEAFVVQTLIDRLGRPDVVGRYFGRGEPGIDLDALRDQSVFLGNELDRLYEAYIDPAERMSRSEYQRNRAMILDQLDEIDAHVAEAGRIDLTAGLRAAADPEQVWDHELSDETRREVVRQTLRVVVLPGRPGQAGGRRFQEDTVELHWL